MSIDDALNLQEFFPYRFSIVEQKISRSIAQHYTKEFNLSRVQWRVIATLAMVESISAKQICDFTLLEKMQVSRAVTHLKNDSLIVQNANGDDRRCHQLSLTPQGKLVYQKIMPSVKREEKSILSNLSHAEKKQLDNILNKLNTKLK